MANKNQNKQSNKNMKSSSSKKTPIILGGVLLSLIVLGLLISSWLPKESEQGDLNIVKSDITETAKFYEYKAGKTKMEVLAVKASDGSIRTAFNTCQVCFNSGRGYYVQEEDELICQNCGNRFQLDQIEVIKGGCNPVPIMEENKTDDGTNIIIAKAFLNENKALFSNWRK